MADDFEDEPLYVQPVGNAREPVRNDRITPDDDEAEPLAEADAPPPRGSVRAAADKVARAARPWFEQAWLNVRVWLPFLRSPDMNLRLVKYRSREQRSGMTWEIGLPKQCWRCGLVDGLTSKKFNRQMRTFEAPTNVLGFSLGFSAFLLLLWIVLGWSSCWKAAFLLTLGGCAWLALKSWKERVRLTLWSCQEHLDELVSPDLVCHDDDLYVFAPSESLAETARAEVAAARKKQGKYRDAMASAPADEGPSRDRTPDDPPSEGRRQNRDASPPMRTIPVRNELPPLKLAGDEDAEGG